MTTKEYLNQAYLVDQRINSKIEQIQYLNALATKCTAVFNDGPVSTNKTGSPMENAVLKIIDLKNEINDDMVELISIKADIVKTIKKIKNVEYQTLIEKRYLNFMTWEDIASDMNYSVQHTFRIHNNALKEIKENIT